MMECAEYVLKETERKEKKAFLPHEQIYMMKISRGVPLIFFPFEFFCWLANNHTICFRFWVLSSASLTATITKGR